MGAQGAPRGAALRDTTADAELVTRMAAGDRSALLAFYERFGLLAWAAALQVLDDREAAAAAVEEGFWDAWQLAHTVEASGQDVRAWVQELVSRRAAEHVHRRRTPTTAPIPEVRRPRGAGRAGPPDRVEQALRARLDATNPRPAPIASRATWIRWGAATAGITLAVALLTAGFVAARYEARIGELSREIARARARLQEEQGALRAESARSTQAIDLLRDPTTRVVDLAGRGRAARAAGRVVWNDDKGGILITLDLPPPPRGERYEVWVFGGAAPRHAGTLEIDAAGRGSVSLPGTPGAPAESFTVTIEAQRTVAPTGPIVLASP